MNTSTFIHNRLVSAALVAIAGFAGGAVFIPGILESTQPGSATTLLPAGAAGAAAYLTAWLAFSSGVSRRPARTAGDVMSRTGPAFAAAMAPLVSYFPYLVYRSSLEGDIAELSPLGSRWSATLLLLWSLVLLGVLLRMVVGPKESPLLGRLTRRPEVALTVLMALWVAVFFSLDVLKDHYMHVTTVNSALFREAMLHVFDSRGFMWSRLLYDYGSSIFGVHINVIFLFILPLFRLLPDYKWLLLISDVALALSAWPAYLIARRHFPQGLSLLIAAMVLLHPIMTAQPGRSDFSELRFLPALFFTAYYFFERKRLGWFMVAALGMMTVREDMGLFVAFFGIYAIFRRYPARWALLPLAAGGIWFVLAAAIILPRLGPSGTATRAALRYSNLGSSGSEIARTLVFKPWRAVQAAFSTPSHIGVAYGLFISFGLGLPLLSGAVVLAVPPVAELMFQETTNLVNFMALASLPALMIAYVNGLSRFDRISHNRWNLKAGRTAALAGVFLFFLGTSSFHAWFNPGLYQPRYNYDAAREVLAQVPEDASLMMPEFMLIYAGREQAVRGFHQIEYEIDLRGSFQVPEDYVIIDRRIPARSRDSRYYRGLEEATRYVAGSPDYRKTYERDDLELYVRVKDGTG